MTDHNRPYREVFRAIGEVKLERMLCTTNSQGTIHFPQFTFCTEFLTYKNTPVYSHSQFMMDDLIPYVGFYFCSFLLVVSVLV